MADGLGISFKISAIDDFSKTMGSLNSTTKKAFDSIGKVGAALTAAGAAGAIGLGATVKVAADFESAMSRVGALSGASADELKRLTANAQEMGAKTSYSATQAAEAQQYLAMAGYKTSEIIAAMPGLLNAAAAGQTDLGTTADITSNILSGFGLQAGETARVADVLTKTFTSSNVDLQMLGDTMRYVAPTANAMGISLEEVAAAAGILGNSGIQGAQAGTSLSMSLTRLASPTKEASELMQQLGFNAFDSQGKMLPLSGVMTNLQTATAGLTEQQKLHAISTIFGAESMKAMLTLLDAGPATLQTFTGELQNAGGTAQTIAEQQLNNLNGQLTILKSGLEAMAISIGTALLPVVKWLATAVQGLVNWFNGLSEGTKTTLAIMAALTSAFMLIAGPIMIMISLLPALMSGLGAIAVALGTTVSAMLTTIAIIGGVVTALALIGAALVVAYNKVDWFRAMVDSAWAWIKNAWNKAVEFISDITKKVMSAVVAFGGEQLAKFQGLWNKHGSAIMTFVKNAFEGIKLTISVAMAAIETIFRTVWPIIEGIVKMAWGVMKVTIGSGIDLVVGLIDAGMSLLKGDWEGAWDAIKGIAEDIWHNIESFFSNIDLVEIGKDVIRGFIEGIGSMKDAVTSKIESIVNAIPKAVRDLLGIHSPSRVLMQLGEYTWQGFAVGIGRGIGGIQQMAGAMANAAVPNVSRQSVSYGINSGGSAVGSYASNQTIVVQSVLDGKVIAETVYPDINRKLYADQQIANRTGGTWRK
ncbi:phage tail tape measure protein [Bacillus sp. MCCB 382]|uniref:phage tail tape measure protein n=1 Tax=Bacillus sp. MCCB 382 TaxID=2860197 RepID=UPI001C571664|nr:phage tail tape measure protein [Bacillus sp. MCCB 382]